MSTSAKVYYYGTIVGADGVTRKFGNENSPTVVTLGSGLSFQRDASLAQNASAIMFSTANDLADFDFMSIESDQDVMLEFYTDLNDSVGNEFYTLKLKADVPLVLGADDSYANYTVDFGGGTLDLIQRVKAKNLGATTAKVTLIAGT